MAKNVLECLLSDKTLQHLRVGAFTLMPNHLHLIAGVRGNERSLPKLVGLFKAYTTQLYWKRSSELYDRGNIVLPSACVNRSDKQGDRRLIASLSDWRATLRPEAVELKHWPRVTRQHFLGKRLWQTGMFDHVIRNDLDLQQNLDYIAMNPVREGYVAVAQFYPYTGMLMQV